MVMHDLTFYQLNPRMVLKTLFFLTTEFKG